MFSGSALSGMFVAVKVLLQIQSSGTLLPHTQQVHRSQSLVTCEGRPPAAAAFFEHNRHSLAGLLEVATDGVRLPDIAAADWRGLGAGAGVGHQSALYLRC